MESRLTNSVQTRFDVNKIESRALPREAGDSMNDFEGGVGGEGR